MKESGRDRGNGNARSAIDKERTKMRERQRRSVTTNIFHGLRKHGGYRLSPRADINEVLRHLAQEAGWIVEHDGTTYRSAYPTVSNGTNACPLCGGGRKSSATPTPSCSYLGTTGGGECSTTASPRRVIGGDSAVNNSPSSASDALVAIYMCGSGAPSQNVGASDAASSYGNANAQKLYLLHEGSVSNQNTPAGSPPQ